MTDRIDNATREPTADDIPQPPELSILNRLEGIKGYVDRLTALATRHAEMVGFGYAVTIKGMADMIEKKLDKVICDIALADEKGESDA